MSRLSDMVSEYLSAQIAAGVDCVQLFDSWVGVLSAADYESLVTPYSRKIFSRIARDYPDTPKIHFGTNTFHLLQAMKEKAGGDVFSIDWRVPIRRAREILGEHTAIQGNLEPATLLSRDLNGFLAKRTQMVLDDNGGSLGHIFNLGHGMLRESLVEDAKFVVEYVHEKTQRN
jgi:uroporphyrinogen decarboxylase